MNTPFVNKKENAHTMPFKNLYSADSHMNHFFYYPTIYICTQDSRFFLFITTQVLLPLGRRPMPIPTLADQNPIHPARFS